MPALGVHVGVALQRDLSVPDVLAGPQAGPRHCRRLATNRNTCGSHEGVRGEKGGMGAVSIYCNIPRLVSMVAKCSNGF